MSAEIIDLDAHRPHYSGWVRCLCGHVWMSVWPETLGDDPDCLECSACGTQASRVLSLVEPVE